MTYTLSLLQDGLMEDPHWHKEMTHSVEANSLDEAKQKWFEYWHKLGKLEAEY